MTERCVFTHQTRLALAAEQARALDAYAKLHAQRDLNELKREFLAQFGLTVRQFNAVRIELDGKVQAIRQRRLQLID
ncbi:hypothetical protein [Azohydromonas australica]|uniref:hypothetical protein n=1 Tax=Azohydromonas australica TaxID=364039 RepID=UPI000409D1DA|nr:hypothetical protein [Azohydromonas australica]